MKFIKGVSGYMSVYEHYIDDIQAFLLYASEHLEYTEEYWRSGAWVHEYEEWNNTISFGDYNEGLTKVCMGEVK